jgi:signal transduction histidine kinase
LRVRLAVLGVIGVVTPLLVLLAVAAWTTEQREVGSDGSSVTETSGVSPWIPITIGVLVVPAALAAWWWAGREVELQARAARAVEDERHLVEDVSHQLRTPIAVLLANADVTLADQRASVGDLRAALQASRDTGASMQEVVEHLLVDARARRLNADLPQTDLVAIAASVCEVHAERAAARGVAIRRTGPGRLTAAIDEAALSRALDAIVDNAVRHAPDGSDVRVAVSRGAAGDGGATIAVTDTGLGILAEHHEEVFRRYWTTDPSSSGIGLAIVAEAARDAFDVELTSPISATGGTAITLRIPARPPQISASAAYAARRLRE